MNQNSKPVSPPAPPVTITPTPPPDAAIGCTGSDFSINNLGTDKGVWLLVDGYSLFIQLMANRIDVDAYPRNGMGLPLATLTVDRGQLPKPDAMDDSELEAHSSSIPADVATQIDSHVKSGSGDTLCTSRTTEM